MMKVQTNYTFADLVQGIKTFSPSSIELTVSEFDRFKKDVAATTLSHLWEAGNMTFAGVSIDVTDD